MKKDWYLYVAVDDGDHRLASPDEIATFLNMVEIWPKGTPGPPDDYQGPMMSITVDNGPLLPLDKG